MIWWWWAMSIFDAICSFDEWIIICPCEISHFLKKMLSTESFKRIQEHEHLKRDGIQYLLSQASFLLERMLKTMLYGVDKQAYDH